MHRRTPRVSVDEKDLRTSSGFSVFLQATRLGLEAHRARRRAGERAHKRTRVSVATVNSIGPRPEAPALERF
jgi:hypothetical protein